MEEEIPKIEETEVNEGFEIHSTESDMQRMGIETEEQESNEEEPTAEVEPQKEEAEEKPKKKSRAQRKIERQNRELKAKNERIAELESKPAAKEDTTVIDSDDYENYDDYLEALASQEEEKPEKEEPKLEEDSRVKDLFDDGNEDYDDFDEKVRDKDLIVSEDLLNEIFEADNPSEVAYYLANNKKLSEKLSSMTPREIAKEVTKIELKLETKPAKSVQVSNAPEPITPLEGNSTKKKSLDDDNLSFEDHEALLNSRANATPGGFL